MFPARRESAGYLFCRAFRIPAFIHANPDPARMTALRRHVRNAHCRTRWRSAAFALALAFGLPALSAAQSPPASDAAPDSTAETVPPVEARVEPVPIALVLPLTSATFGRAAEAVRAGFLAAAEARQAKPLVIGHGDDDVVAAFAKAKDAGARVIVGPLVRDDVKTSRPPASTSRRPSR